MLQPMLNKWVLLLLVGFVGFGWLGCGGMVSSEVEGWPPRVGARYPDLDLLTPDGKTVSLSEVADGKILLLEPIGMTCEACQAFAGGNQKGGLRGVHPQKNLKGIAEIFPSYAQGVSLSDDRIVYVQLILYNMAMAAPSTEDLKTWASHFEDSAVANYYVLGGSKALLGSDSYHMIPGFHLVDKDFVLRSDSTGHHPKDNLYTGLMPMVRALLDEGE